MKKLAYIFYALICYGLFFTAFLYMIGFVENIGQFGFNTSLTQWFPKTLDTGSASMATFPAIIVDLCLIALFGVQHSVMARQGFKKQWTKVVPKPIERSTYVLFASLALFILYFGWQPVKATIWDFDHTLTGKLFFGASMVGWGMLLISTFLINHFDLFGLRQVYRYAQNKKPDHIRFRTPWLYRLVRHPIYFSFLMIFWFAPVMTVGHFVFSLGMSTYIFIGIYHEEKDLMRFYGDDYHQYRIQVPKIIPFTK
ncbi:MAG TPA: hypothetical protein VKA27_16055 [Sunxiuqinia sp.]|nr:hypothetical protein [Sunxiuqinia sp.]